MQSFIFRDVCVKAHVGLHIQRIQLNILIFIRIIKYIVNEGKIAHGRASVTRIRIHSRYLDNLMIINSDCNVFTFVETYKQSYQKSS